MSISIRKMAAGDWEQVSGIYRQGIESNLATFEVQVPTYEVWDLGHLEVGRLVAINEENEVVGWVSLSPFGSRDCFKGVAEISIYLDQNSTGQGVGSLLMSSVIDESENHGLWSVFSGIFPENVASIKLHQKFSFREIGYREKVGKSVDGKFRDVVYYERRSTINGA